MKQTNLPPTRGKWFTAGILTMIADITGTLAQFMPMKAVFILAADDIPSFFPSILVNAGPILTGLALVLAAAVLAIISKFAKDLALTRSGANEPYPTPTPSAVTNPAATDTAPITVKEFSAFVLIVVLFAGSAAVSLTFVLTITAWIVGSAIVLAIKIHRGSRKPPFPNGRVEFVSGFKKWMIDSALWAAVGAAIFTLVVDFPALGLTGILLGAVLLRRMQQVVPDVVPLLMARFSPESAVSGGSVALSSPTQAPYDFLATPVGNRLLTRSLQDLGLDSENWQVVGRPDNVQITLLTKNLNSGESVLLRIFASGQERSLDHEYALRSNLSDPRPFHHKSVIKAPIAGLPSLILSYGADHNIDPDRPLDAKTAIRWQMRWEVRCVESESLQKGLSDYVVPDPKQFLLPLLTRANGINGHHKQHLTLLVKDFNTLHGHYINGPRVIHFGKAVSQTNAISINETKVEPLDVRGWGVDLWGAKWSDSREFLNQLSANLENDRHLADQSVALQVRFRTHILSRALQAKNLPGAALQGATLNDLLHSDSNDH